VSRAPESPFWDFSNAVYGRPGVAEACLALQDRRGLDVNILLLCCWAGVRGRALTAAALGARIEAVRPWRDQVVKPLRAARRWLKGQQTVPSESAEALRQAIKAQELEAERLEQLILAEGVTIGEGQGGAALAVANLRAYFLALDLVPGARDRADLAVLLCGLFDGLARDKALTLLG
jgi:uncharacterized protein (TIGR02444 family)